MKFISVLAATVLVALAAPAAASAAPDRDLTVPVQQQVQNIDGKTVTLNGTYDVKRITIENGQTVAYGDLTYTVSQAIAGAGAGPVTQEDVRAVVGSDRGSRCTILTLDLQPVFLDLLGLQVDLSAVNLDLTAVSGQNRLLGNLLCTVTGLLDPQNPGGGNGGGPVGSLIGLLNRILGG
jgi:hypothetical protein